MTAQGLPAGCVPKVDLRTYISQLLALWLNQQTGSLRHIYGQLFCQNYSQLLKEANPSPWYIKYLWSTVNSISLHSSLFYSFDYIGTYLVAGAIFNSCIVELSNCYVNEVEELLSSKKGKSFRGNTDFSCPLDFAFRWRSGDW